MVNFAEGDISSVVKWLSDAADALVKELNNTHINATKICGEAGPGDIILVRVGSKALPPLHPPKAVKPCTNLEQ